MYSKKEKWLAKTWVLLNENSYYFSTGQLGQAEDLMQLDISLRDDGMPAIIWEVETICFACAKHPPFWWPEIRFQKLDAFCTLRQMSWL